MNALLEYFPYIASAVVLLCLNAVLAACEWALFKTRFSHFNPELMERLQETKAAKHLLEKADETTAVLRLGQGASALGFGLVLHPPLLELFPANTFYYSLLTFILCVGLFFVIADILPRGLGMKYPQHALTLSCSVVRILQFIAYPILKPLSALTSSLLKGLGAEKEATLESMEMEAQFESQSDLEDELSEVAQKILRNAMNLRKLEVADVLLPRNQVICFDLYDSAAENLEEARRTGHTRFPLIEGDLDKCIGLIHIKDIFRSKENPLNLDFRKLHRSVLRIGLDEMLETALSKLLTSKTHMALVIDEFGGTVGVLTLERILEVLVGEIQDEFDSEEAHIRKLPNGEYLIQGLTPVHEIEESFHFECENEEVSTFSGLITSQMGCIPSVGAKSQLGPLSVLVTEVDGKRVLKARVRLD